MVAIRAAGRRLLPPTFFDSRAIVSWNIGTSCRRRSPPRRLSPAIPCLRNRDRAWRRPVREDFRKDISRNDVPTLILHGDADRILLPDATSRRQAKMIKDVKLSFLV